ncbi:MAG: glycerate kinase [Candidatus Omnitrophica bacterium]|nr:glycerate kinase [Candidatus Omnitrophota bacterium]MCM8803254.1 glycerate kinase [Candidatus Omnitrophota bacterium]
MKIVICPNSFKGCLSSVKVAKIIQSEIKKLIPWAELINFPIADGGDGTLDVLKNIIGGKFIEVKVSDPLFRKLNTRYIKKQKDAYIEMAKVSGLALLKEKEKNPLKTTTYGLGQLILDAIERKCKKIYIGVGGSATNDGGIGALTCLGFKFIDKNQKIIFPGKGKDLLNIDRVEYPENYKNLKEIEFIILSDVKNPLYGKNGAAYVYGPQKGADGNIVKLLDDGLKNYARVIKKYTGLKVNQIKGSGAAGGVVAGFLSFLNVKVVSGIEEILKIGKFQEKIKNANLIITGEGKIDRQTFYGKGVGIILKYSEKYKIPTIVLAGIVDEDVYRFVKSPYISIFSIVPSPCSVEESIKNSEKYIKIKINQLLKFLTTRL